MKSYQSENPGKENSNTGKYSLVILEANKMYTAEVVEMSGKTAYFIPSFDIPIKYSST